MPLLPSQCRAARGLLNWSQEQLAMLAGVSRSTIKDFECHRHALHRSSEDLLVSAFETGGVQFLFEEDAGPGVRLKSRRQEGR
ncbi:helix-turn-helix domain-containing protein [Mesorhizobium sp. CGMCC 1.15528]|uniref:Helix-turn-helix domain-containing protein n=1 Tax=Mesorhizobium zhangyense TaxID=1776730 RepID=A0A7C9R732_9HYPH|nr:helix-turn-helix domain-containing protein [Mesorhizobium zhangyense]NGN41777.1 helix-turn-helix domain-containing protein [Mesorhizobium zhangyense]